MGQLSFEQVPPEAAYNDEPVYVITGDMFSIGPDEDLRGRIQQRGAGGHTLCISCNSRIGHWYGRRI